MKKYLGRIALLAMLLVIGCSSGAKAPLSNGALVSQIGNDTVALIMYHDSRQTTKSTGYQPFCTGVWVDERHILTADHCAKAEQSHEQERLDERKKKAEEEEDNPMAQILKKLFGIEEEAEDDTVAEKGLKIRYTLENEVIDPGKEPSGMHLSQVVGYDEDHDLALLEVIGVAVPAHGVVRLADKSPAIGEKVHIVGQTVGMYWTYLEGMVSSYRGADMLKSKKDGVKNLGPWMQVASPMFHGNSGGGAFNEYGELVGIADWIKSAPEMGFFIHLDTIRHFLSTNLK